MFLVLALVLSSTLSGESLPDGSKVDTLTLEHAIEMALQQNPAVRGAALDEERAGEQVVAARSHRFPALQAQATAGKLLTPLEFDFKQGAFGVLPGGVGPVPPKDITIKTAEKVTGNVNATVAQPLSQLYKVGLGVRAAELSRDLGAEKLRAQRQAVTVSVRKLYYAILQWQSALQAAEEQVTLYREVDRFVSRQVVEQTALRADGLEAKAGVASAELRVMSIRNILMTEKEQLNQLLGRDVRTAFAVAVVPVMSAEEQDLEAARARALRDRPDLREARLAVDQADTDRRSKAAEYIPDISIAFQYYSFFNIDVLPRNLAQVALTLSWEPFDWGRRSKELAQKRIAEEQARIQVRNAESAALIDVGDKFRRLQEARAQVEASGLALEAARARLPVLLNRQQAQAALRKDVINAQAALANATRDREQSLLSLWSAKADFEQALGE